jgi:DNA-binding response OmpR family regulator
MARALSRRIDCEFRCRTVRCVENGTRHTNKRTRRLTGKEGTVAESQRVLVVDGLSETEEVLKAVLEPQGHEVERIQSSEAAISPFDTNPPAVVVYHADEGQVTRDCEFWRNVPRVIIGSARLADPQQDTTSGSERFLRNPFDYRDLILEIETLLESSRC